MSSIIEKLYSTYISVPGMSEFICRRLCEIVDLCDKYIYIHMNTMQNHKDNNC